VYNVVFDGLYWSFGAAILLGCLATLARSVAHLRHASGDRLSAEATIAAASGVLVALVVGVGLNAVRSVIGDLPYQQVHFAAFYLGFALVLWSFDRLEMTGDHAVRHGRVLRAVAWGAFVLATLVVIEQLLTPATYRVVSTGQVRYVQQPQFYLPVFVVLVAGAAWLPRAFPAGREQAARPWLAVFAAFVFLGMLREATLIPSTDEPLVDLLLAFVPFTIGALCLYHAAGVGVRRMPASGG
jgi:hypothetical protein